MKAVVDLFSTDYGLMSLGVIVTVIGLWVYFLRLFSKKADESERAARKS